MRMAALGRYRAVAGATLAGVMLATAAFVWWREPSSVRLAATRRRAEQSARPSPASEARPQRPTGAASKSGAVAPPSSPVPHRQGPAAPSPAAFPGFQHGVNFTAEWPGGYGSAAAVTMLRQLPGYGVDAIALVPYAFTPPHSTVVRMGGGLESERGMLRLAEVAHGLGMKVMLKPQVWTRGGYPGDLQFASAAREQAWFGQYRRYLLHEAALAVQMHADLLCVGVELSHLSRNEAEWRRLIAATRTVYHGPLVYAANPGDEFEHLRFWDALDFIGLDEYYPLPDSLDTTVLVRRVAAVQARVHKPVLLTEAGFPSQRGANRHPWDDAPAPMDLQLQARAYAAILAAFYPQRWCAGMYWWKIGTSGFGGAEDGSHTPWGKPAMQVMAQWYRSRREAALPATH